MCKYDKLNEEKHTTRGGGKMGGGSGLVLGYGFKYRTSLDLGSSSRG